MAGSALVPDENIASIFRTNPNIGGDNSLKTLITCN
jgi:hypothetical protein